MSERIAVEVDGPLARVWLGDGARHNALRTGDWKEMARILEAMAEDGTTRCVTVGGVGGTFSAGSDIEEWDGASVEDADESFRQMERAFRAVEQLPVPVIASVAGVATGAGCQLAMSCDLRVVATTARLGMPVARLGVLLSAAFADRITWLAGAGVARDLLYTGRLISGTDAQRMGLAERCVTPDLVAATTDEIAAAIASLPPSTVHAAKLATRRDPQVAYVQGHSVDPDAFAAGVGRFLSRRRPTVTGPPSSCVG